MNVIKFQTFVIFIEFCCGIVFGILGGYLYSFFDTKDLLASVANTFLCAFVASLIGIELVGYFHLRALGRLKQFGTAIFYSFLGLVSFLILYIVIYELTFRLIPHYLSSVILPVLLPIAGGVMGFNLKIRK